MFCRIGPSGLFETGAKKTENIPRINEICKNYRNLAEEETSPWIRIRGMIHAAIGVVLYPLDQTLDINPAISGGLMTIMRMMISV